MDGCFVSTHSPESAKRQGSAGRRGAGNTSVQVINLATASKAERIAFCNSLTCVDVRVGSKRRSDHLVPGGCARVAQ